MAKRKQIAHDEVVERFGGRLREVRLARGMTQERLAELAGASSAYIGRLERGTGGAVGIDLLAKLAAALGTTAADLLPAEAGPDEAAVLREEAKRLLNDLLKSGDVTTISLAVQLLSRLSQTAAGE